MADLQRAGDCAGLVRLLVQLQERGRAPEGELAAVKALADLAELPGWYGLSAWLLSPVISALAAAVSAALTVAAAAAMNTGCCCYCCRSW